MDLRFKPVKNIICGTPSVVINRDGIDPFQLKKNDLDVSDLVESMRSEGYFNLDDVYYGLFEANGSFSALEKEEKAALSLPLILVDLGKPDKKNIAKCGFDGESFKKFLTERGAKLKDVVAMTVNGEGRTYLQIEVPEKW